MRLRLIADVYLVLGVVIAALWPVVLNLATSIDVFEFTFLAYLLALPASLAFVVLAGKTKDLSKVVRSKRDLAVVLTVGVLNYGFMDFGILFAEHYVSASLAAVLFRSYPLLMLFFLPFILRERISATQIAALLLGFVGIIIAIMIGSAAAVSASTAMYGIAMTLAVALATAFSLTLTKRYIYDTEGSILIFNIVSAVFFGVAFLAEGAPLAGITPVVVGALLFTAVIANVLFAFIYYMSIRMLKITVVTNAYLMVPFLTFFFSYLLLGQPMLPYYFLIGAFVSAGLILQRFDKVGGTYLARRAHKLSNFIIFDVSGAFANTGEVAISSAIRDGGRVLAMKLGEKHRKAVHDLVTSGNHVNVFTDKHDGITNEVSFVRDILGAGEKDMVVMKAGAPEEGERFFEALSGTLEDSAAEPETQVSE